MFIRYRYSAVIIFAILLFFKYSNGQETTARFLLLQPSARSAAMGGVGTSLADDPFAGYYNPAALVFSPSLGLTGSFVKPVPFFGNTIHSYLSAIYVLNTSNAIGISTNMYHRANQILDYYGYSTEVSTLEKNNVTSWEGKVSYSHLMRENISIGISAAILRLNLVDPADVGNSFYENKNPTGWLFDIGLLAKDLLPEATLTELPLTNDENLLASLGSHREGKGLSVGFSILNFGTKVSQIDPAQSDNTPSLLSFGSSYTPITVRSFGILVAVELEKQLHESSTLDYIHFGGEITLMRLLSFRAGYFDGTSGPSNSYGTFGFGLDVKFFHFNIARYNNTLEPTWHFDSTLSMEF